MRLASRSFRPGVTIITIPPQVTTVTIKSVIDCLTCDHFENATVLRILASYEAKTAKSAIFWSIVRI